MALPAFFEDLSLTGWLVVGVFSAWLLWWVGHFAPTHRPADRPLRTNTFPTLLVRSRYLNYLYNALVVSPLRKVPGPLSYIIFGQVRTRPCLASQRASEIRTISKVPTSSHHLFCPFPSQPSNFNNMNCSTQCSGNATLPWAATSRTRFAPSSTTSTVPSFAPRQTVCRSRTRTWQSRFWSRRIIPRCVDDERTKSDSESVCRRARFSYARDPSLLASPRFVQSEAAALLFKPLNPDALVAITDKAEHRRTRRFMSQRFSVQGIAKMVSLRASSDWGSDR